MSHQKKVVVVVDDDAAVRASMKHLLSAFGYVIYSFDSAEAFLKTASQSKADCLVIDIQLKDMSGVELGRGLKAAGFRYPIIFMSGSDNKMFRNDALQLGCVAYLQKPFAAHLLLEAIVKATGETDGFCSLHR
jgi:FixJ family two-component response regulator